MDAKATHGGLATAYIRVGLDEPFTIRELLDRARELAAPPAEAEDPHDLQIEYAWTESEQKQREEEGRSHYLCRDGEDFRGSWVFWCTWHWGDRGY